MPYQAGKRRSVETEPAQVNVAELAVAVGSYLEKHLEDLKDSMNNVAHKLEESAQVVDNTKTSFEEFFNAAEKRQEIVAKEIQELAGSMNNALVSMADQMKASFIEKLKEHIHAQIVSRNSSVGTTAEADVEPYVIVEWEGKYHPMFLPASVREALGVQTILRGVVRVILRHFHPINELRNFTLKGFGIPESDEEESNGDDGNVEEAPRVQVPARSLAIALAVANKCHPISAIVQRTDPTTYARLLSARQNEVRKAASRIFQYFKNRYDSNGVMKPKQRCANQRRTDASNITIKRNLPGSSSIIRNNSGLQSVLDDTNGS